MKDMFLRTEMLLGSENLKKLSEKTVAVFGLGGVGGYCVEALARVSVGNLVLCDNDTINASNLNRQIFALQSTLGQKKTHVAKLRVADINPLCRVTEFDCFFDSKTSAMFDFEKFDFVVDAIDTVTSKLLLVELCKKANTPIVSCMSTGNKLNSTEFSISDISQTQNCPLARVMRRELKKRGIEKLEVVFSPELPRQQQMEVQHQAGKRQTPASISFVPPVAGFALAEVAVKRLLGI